MSSQSEAAATAGDVGGGSGGKPPSGGKIFSEQELKSMMNDEGDEVPDTDMTDAQPSNMELDMLAAASEAEARIAEEKMRAEKMQMAREDKVPAPPKKRKEKEDEPKKKVTEFITMRIPISQALIVYDSGICGVRFIYSQHNGTG